MNLAAKLAEMGVEIANLVAELHSVDTALQAQERITVDCRLKMAALKARAAVIGADCIAARRSLELQ